MSKNVKDFAEGFKCGVVSIFLTLFIVLLIFMAGYNVAHGAVIEENLGSSIDTENFGTSAGKGQSFEHNADFDLESIEIWGGLGDSPASALTLTIYEGEGTGGTSICTESAYDITSWPNWSSADWQEITISCVGLSANTRYTFEVTADDGDSGDAIRWATSDTSYPNGQEYFGGSGRGTRDTMFIVNGTEVNSGGGGGTTTATSTEMVIFDPSQTWFNAILLFYLTSGFMVYLLRRRR